MGAALNPLPSLIQAAGHDAAARRMRAAGRKVWNRADYNEACRTERRLIRACYSRPGEGPRCERPLLRFSIAIQMQRAGRFDLSSDFGRVLDVIDAFIAAPMPEAA